MRHNNLLAMGFMISEMWSELDKSSICDLMTPHEDWSYERHERNQGVLYDSEIKSILYDSEIKGILYDSEIEGILYDSWEARPERDPKKDLDGQVQRLWYVCSN